MNVIIATISIIAISLIGRFAVKFLPFKICPLCAGISLTWLLLHAGILTGLLPPADYKPLMAILMGGTAAGIAYQGEKRFNIGDKNSFYFKLPVIAAGFIMAYWAINNLLSWAGLFMEAGILAIIAYVYFIRPDFESGGRSSKSLQKIRALAEKMKNCC